MQYHENILEKETDAQKKKKGFFTSGGTKLQVKSKPGKC